MGGSEEEDPGDLVVEDFETLRCSWNFVAVCVAMPFFNGQINGVLTAVCTLHFVDMGWPIVRAGLAVSLGFALRVITQQVMLRAGYWIAVPLCIVHLTFATLAIFFGTSEWSVFGQIMVIFGIDAAVAVEGISFDTFGDSEIKARTAASITLATFTMSVALACSIGAVFFDTLGWVGLAAYHAGCQGALIFLLCVQGACRQSFMRTFFPPHQSQEEEEKGQQSAPPFVRVVPAPPVMPETLTLPGATEPVAVVDIDHSDSEGLEGGKILNSGASRLRLFSDPEDQEGQAWSKLEVVGSYNSQSRSRRHSAASNRGRNSLNIHSSIGSGNVSSISSQASRASKISQVSRVSERAQLLTNSFANKSLQPEIVGATGADAMPRYDTDLLNDIHQDEAIEAAQPSNEMQKPSPSKAGIPKDIRFPAFLIVMYGFYGNMAYAMEFATFALLFREVHHWDQATWAGLAQTAGDLAAAIVIQMLSRSSGTNYDEAEAGCCRRLVHHLTSSPYNLSFLLAGWVLLNLGMISPVLPVAIAAQVVMGTVFVYGSKWTNDLTFFYSSGDPQVFMSLQVSTKNAEALGGAFAGIIGIALYTWEPWAPFACCAAMSCVALVLYTAGFCSRLGFGDDIEVAETKRARTRGVRRVTSWKSDRQKSQTSVVS